MSFPPVASLLRHGPPMRLLDEVIGESAESLVCRTTIRDDFPFLRDGEAEVAVCLELAAQAVACLTGLADRRRNAEPRPGLLVGVRDAKFIGAPLRVGDELDVTVTKRWVRDPVACFHGFVERRSERIADLEVTVVATDDLDSAMEALQHGG